MIIIENTRRNCPEQNLILKLQKEKMLANWINKLLKKTFHLLKQLLISFICISPISNVIP